MKKRADGERVEAADFKSTFVRITPAGNKLLVHWEDIVDDSIRLTQDEIEGYIFLPHNIITFQPPTLSCNYAKLYTLNITRTHEIINNLPITTTRPLMPSSANNTSASIITTN